MATIRSKNSWSSASDLPFSKVAMFRRFCFCSAVRQWGTHRADIFLFFKSFIKIRNTDVAGIPLALESSSHVAWRSSSRTSVTSFTLLTSVDILGLPGLGSLSMLTQPPWKRLSKRETVLWSAVNYKSFCIQDFGGICACHAAYVISTCWFWLKYSKSDLSPDLGAWRIAMFSFCILGVEIPFFSWMCWLFCEVDSIIIKGCSFSVKLITG